MANHHTNNPPLDGWFNFRAATRERAESQTRDMRETPALVEPITGLTMGMARGEEAAFRKFHEAYFRRLFHYLLVVSGGQEELAKDALQSTLVRVARHSRAFDSEPVFWSWLTVLARSALVDEQRKRKRYGSLLDRFLSHFTMRSAPAAIHAIDDTRLATLLEMNLAHLPPEDRALLESKYYDDQSIKAIAAVSGCSEKAVESRLGRARRQLKKLILTQLKDEDRL